MRVEQQTGRRCTLLAEKIKERGITQADVAIGLDITRASMSRKMNGMQPFKIIEIFKIIQILEIPKEEIYDIFSRNMRTSSTWMMYGRRLKCLER